MTELADQHLDFAALEAEFTPHLALGVDAQNLLFRDARTPNSFTDEPVTDAQLEAIYELAKWAPTAMNSQPLRVLAVRSDEARARLIPHLAGSNQARTASAPLVLVLAADYDFHDDFAKTFPVFPGARDVFADESTRIESATMNATLQMGYFIVAIRAAGLTAGPMTGFDADGVTREFFADGRHRALMVVNVGHAAADAFRPRQPRLDYDEAVATV
jgi:nitroreductase